MIQKAIHDVIDGKDLDFDTTKAVMNEIMSGGATQAQMGSFLTALRMKGEMCIRDSLCDVLEVYINSVRAQGLCLINEILCKAVSGIRFLQHLIDAHIRTEVIHKYPYLHPQIMEMCIRDRRYHPT